jgi:quercetin dioxygenase-like cupin family protein
MDATVVRSEARRRVETPNAVMTTCLSPTLGDSAGLSMWRIEMAAGASGPLHSFDSEQLWSVLSGAATVAVNGAALELEAGDSIAIPADAERQIIARTAAELVVSGRADAAAWAAGEPEPRGVPAWIA